MVYETDEASVLAIEALIILDDDKMRILVAERGTGVLLSAGSKLPLHSWTLVLISFLGVGSVGESLTLAWKDPLPLLANGSFDHGRIEFSEENIKRMPD